MTSNLSAGVRPVAGAIYTRVLPKACSISKNDIQARQNPLKGNCFHRCSSTCPCRSRSTAVAAVTSNGSTAVASKDIEVPMRDYEQSYLAARTDTVNKSFPGSLLVDDFIHRLEIGLYSYGFTGDNSIACTNLCRDEITSVLKKKIDVVFGNSFNVNGLGGVLTSGVLGVGAGLSHSPVDAESGKERYVFFSFPHIAVSPFHKPGVLTRSGRPGDSAACGALVKALGDFKADGLEASSKTPGVHEPENPEYSILKQRLARRIQRDGKSEKDIPGLDLVELTKVAERAISSDLEFLISKAVDPEKADYAVVTGVQIHSWGKLYDDESPNLEFVQPCMVYTVVNGQKTALDLSKIPALTPRQIKELAFAQEAKSGSQWSSAHDITDRAPILEKNKYKELLSSLE